MTHVLIDTTHSAAFRATVAGIATRAMPQLARALAAAGCQVTVLADPDGIPTPALAHVRTVLAHHGHMHPDTLDELQPDACIIWNGSHLPPLAASCRERGARVIFAEAGWFEPDRSVFLDNWGVLVGSSLSEFRADPGLSDAARRVRLEPIARTPQRVRLARQDYLLVVLEPGDGRAYFDPRHSDPLVLIGQLRARFPDLALAVRAHPADRLGALPEGAFDATKGSVFDWAAHCTAAVGASSKAVFAAALYGRPAVLIGGSVASGPRPSPAFVQRNRVTAITEADLLDHSRCIDARAFVYEAIFHRHVVFDQASPQGLRDNRVLAPLLLPPGASGLPQRPRSAAREDRLLPV